MDGHSRDGKKCCHSKFVIEAEVVLHRIPGLFALVLVDGALPRKSQSIS